MNTGQTQIETPGGPATLTSNSICLVCHKTYAGHVRANGKWRGCKANTFKAASDGTMFFVPMMSMANVADVPLRGNQATAKARKARAERKSLAGATEKATAKETAVRGRHPGIYKLNPKAELKTPFRAGSVLERTYAAVKRRPGGVKTADIIEKVGVTQGSAGWALWKLATMNLVKHEAAEAA